MTRAATWQQSGEIASATLPEPSAEPGAALIEVAWCGICGSDLHAFKSGRGIDRGQILGHELSGRLLAAPDAEGFAVGDRVVVRPVLQCGRCPRCLAGEVNLCEHQVLLGFQVPGGFAEQVSIPRASIPDVLLHVPDGVDLRVAALVEPLAVGLRAARLSEAGPGDSGLVVGCGPIGLAAVRFLAAMGVRPLVASDPSPLRRRFATEMGASEAVDPTAADSGKALKAALADRAGFDLAIECAGLEVAVGAAVRSVRRGGRVVLAALHGRKVPVSLDRIVDGELTLHGSFAYRDEMRRVLELMAAGRLEGVERLITHEFGLDRVQEAFDTQTRVDEAIKVMLRIGEDRGRPGSSRHE